MNDGQPRWDQHAADRLLGGVVLVGLTYRAAEETQVTQFFGTVIEADRKSGILLQLGGTRQGETYRLPPDPQAFFPASPGSYRLRETGEVVVDPDYTTTWERNERGT